MQNQSFPKPFVLLFLLYYFVPSSNLAFGQSTPISTPASTGLSGSGDYDFSKTMVRKEPKNDLAMAILSTEAKLNRSLSADLYGKVSWAQVFNWLKQNGIPCSVHETFRDHVGDLDAPFVFRTPSKSLGVNLRFELQEYGTGITIDPSGAIQFATVEQLEYSPFSINIDLEGFPEDDDQILDNITELVHPDSWEDAGGTGRIRIYQGNRRLLQVSNSYKVVRDLRQFMANLSFMDGPTTNRIAGSPNPQAIGSTVVRLPNASSPFDRDSHSSGGGFGGGGGGFGGRGGAGLGGGIF